MQDVGTVADHEVAELAISWLPEQYIAVATSMGTISCCATGETVRCGTISCVTTDGELDDGCLSIANVALLS